MLVEAWLIVKYYTNLELPENPEDEDYEKLFDYLLYNELARPLMEAVSGDYFGYVEGITHLLIEAAKTVHEKEHSLAHKVDRAFGFLFTGEDLTNQIAQAEGINEKLVDMFDAVREREQKNAMLKNSKAKVNSGGAVLNMAKK
jgi:hypothetical protein